MQIGRCIDCLPRRSKPAILLSQLVQPAAHLQLPACQHHIGVLPEKRIMQRIKKRNLRKQLPTRKPHSMKYAEETYGNKSISAHKKQTCHSKSQHSSATSEHASTQTQTSQILVLHKGTAIDGQTCTDSADIQASDIHADGQTCTSSAACTMSACAMRSLSA